jgi:hypothetical protein
MLKFEQSSSKVHKMAVHKMAIHKMRMFSSSRIFFASRSGIVSAFLGAGLCLPVAALARRQEAQSSQSGSQDSSVADAARRSRDKKKNPSTNPKFSKVITDDDLAQRNYQPGPDVLNLGASNKSEADANTQGAAGAEAADNASEEVALKEAKEQDAEIATLKLKISNAETDLDLDRRQLALDQDSYFANPDYTHDVAGKAKLDGEKQQINDKQQAIERLKTRLAAVEELKSRRKPAQAKPAPAPAQPAAPQTQSAPPPQTEQPENPPL